MRQGWLLLVSIVLFLLALSIDLPFGKTMWGKAWPEAHPGLDVKGGFRVILQAVIDGKRYDEWSAKDKEDWKEKRRTLPGILENRLKGPFGAAEATVVAKGQDQFIVEIPGVTNVQEVLNILQTTARLEFWWAKNVQTSQDSNRPFKQEQAVDSKGEEIWNFTNTQNNETLKSGSNELYQMIKDNWYYQDEVGKPILDGSMLVKAAAIPEGSRGTVVQLVFNNIGAKRLADFSRQVFGKGEYMAIVLDKTVISFPTMNAVITNGEAVIEGGNMTAKDAKRLETLLKAGALPVDLEQISMTKVEPTIGSTALDMIIKAGLVGFTLIALFMMAYYLIPGALAVVALIFYSIYAYAVFKLMGVTFSLAGIAGFLLSIGMAVDANVLIFERMKEELRTGKSLLAAIDAGFKRAFSAIFDSNMCTIITCVILYNWGTGPVKGFAGTLGIGVAISLFTAITLTRLLLYLLVGKGGVANPKLFALGRQWFGKPLHVVQRMGVYFAISLLVIVPGVIFWVQGGFKTSIEFGSGAEIIYTAPASFNKTNAEVQQTLAAAGFPDTSIQLATLEGGQKQLIVRMRQLKYYPALKDKDVFEQRKAVADALAPIGVAASVVDVPHTTADGTTIMEKKIQGEESFSEVGEVISSEIVRNSFIQLAAALLLILAYLSVRFAIEGGWSGFKFGLAALVATGHDVLVVLGAAAIFGYFMNWEVTSLFITAVLTIVGFSVHDTIVIFDRIRENLRYKKKGETFDELVNNSITQSFARSINTSLTVVIMLTCLLFLGSAMPDLKHFNAIMLVGVLSGTYSSIFNASPILVLIERWTHARGGQTLEAAVKEREKKEEGRLRFPPAAGGGKFAQTGRELAQGATGDGEAATNGTEDGTTEPQQDTSGRPKSKKPKRRF